MWDRWGIGSHRVEANKRVRVRVRAAGKALEWNDRHTHTDRHRHRSLCYIRMPNAALYSQVVLAGRLKLQDRKMQDYRGWKMTDTVLKDS